MRSLIVLFLFATTSLVSAQPPKKARPKAVIELGDVSVRFDGKVIARLHKDGTTEMLGSDTDGPRGRLVAGPKLHSDGRIDLRTRGFKARIAEDGKILVVAPESAKIADETFGQLQGDRVAMSSGIDLRLEGPKIISVYKEQADALGVISPPRRARAGLVLVVAVYIELALATR